MKVGLLSLYCLLSLLSCLRNLTGSIRQTVLGGNFKENLCLSLFYYLRQLRRDGGWKERLGLTSGGIMFTHSKDAFCHLRVQMVMKPTEKDGWVEAPQGKLGTVVFQEKTAIPD